MTLDFFAKLRENTERLPDHVALQLVGDEGREPYTYARLSEEIGKISLYLQNQGIKPGDTVGIVMENHPRWGIAFLAAQSAGARVVPFDVLHTAQTLAGLISHSESSMLIVSSTLLEKFEEVQTLLPKRLPALILGEGCDGYDRWEKVLEATPEAPSIPLVERSLDETLVIVYTSGTTGDPKGVMLTERSVYRNVVEVLKAIDVSPQDHVLAVLPLYHVLALMANFIIPLYVGARVTYLDELDPQKIMRAFRDEGITAFACVPQFYYLMYRRILQEVERQSWLKRRLFRSFFSLSRFCNRNLSINLGKLLFGAIHRRFGKMRLFAVGGARFDPQIAHQMRALGFNLAQAYGLTETSAVSTIALWDSNGLGSVGKPMPHVKLEIDQPDDGGIGEVLIGGEHLMKGYWRNPSATAEALQNGWLHTGDLGRIDEKGFLHITGRKKDVIVLSSGKNIFPEEVEYAYEQKLPLIAEMCVLGVKDSTSELGEEKLHAVIVPDFEYMKKNQVVNLSEMMRYLLESTSQQFPAHKRVRSFEIRREPLPRTTTRKIKRFEIQQGLKADESAGEPRFEGEPYRPRGPVEEKIYALIRGTGKIAEVHPEMSLELDCGFDSLERVAFLSNIQDSFQVTISDSAATDILHVKDLVKAVEQRLSGEIDDQAEETTRSWAKLLNAPLSEEEEQAVHRLLRRRPIIELIYCVGTTLLLWTSAKILFRLKIRGTEHLPNDYPFLICPNHLSFTDGFFLAPTLPFRVLRRQFYLGYSSYFVPGSLTGWLGSLIKVVPVDADRNLRKALRLGAVGLREKLVLGVFPEGERSIDGTLKRFRKGPAILAVELQVPVVPCAILGTYEVWARGTGKFRLHPVSVRFGPPLKPPPHGEGAYEEFTHELREAVARLIEEERSE